jgi:hypothetical protein
MFLQGLSPLWQVNFYQFHAKEDGKDKEFENKFLIILYVNYLNLLKIIIG